MTEDHGVIAAALTPRGKRGDIDFGAAFELIDQFCRAGIQGIAFFTAVGEYPAFGVEERARLLYLAVKRSRVAVYAGTGSMSLDDSVYLAREACSAGAAGVLAPPPHFYSYSQDEIGDFYLDLAAQTPKDLATYISNTPSVATAIQPATALRLLETGQFAGIEDPGAPEDGTFAHRPFAWLAGDDSTAARARTAGAHGVVSAVANAAPELVHALDCASRSGRHAEAEHLDTMLQDFHARARGFIQPVILKVAAEMRGIKVGAPSPPVSAGRQRALDEFREWFRGWLPAVKKLTAHA
ncbi:MAG TPA: dihydrodipicolinate synthase family protein [Candidatus Acidoferrales bacterium]|nr:dihydrodipicolinate synthase family protein [Candidatus Acidoferrales bacterium]